MKTLTPVLVSTPGEDNAEVSEFLLNLPSLMNDLKLKTESFVGGRIKYFVREWRTLTSDPEILEMVEGLHIDFESDIYNEPPLPAPQPTLTGDEKIAIDTEICKLLGKGVISLCNKRQDDFVSPIFTRLKKDGSHRMILNLKNLNLEIVYHHFKMDTLNCALKLITKNCFMTSIDLKDAYYSVPIAEGDRKFLRFWWGAQLYEFNCLPNGLSLAPRKFTKLLKPVFSTLRKEGHVSTAFIDDSLLLGETQLMCVQNVKNTLALMSSLGFVIHPDKSVLKPSQRITYLGVVIDSVSMTVCLTDERALKIVESCENLLNQDTSTIREVARVIGQLVAAFPAVKFGALHYRYLEGDKILALAENHGCYDADITLSAEAKQELVWWKNNVKGAYNDIWVADPDTVITTDASLIGWGCSYEGVQTGGHWLPLEKLFHINYLELKAAFLALQSFTTRLENKHVRLLMDNTTAVACINHMGTSHSTACNEMTLAIWRLCQRHSIWLSAAFLPGRENVIADAESRNINIDAEWMLNKAFFLKAMRLLQWEPSIDLFASRVNAQLPCYMAYRPDPGAVAVDAFTVSWREYSFYAFPPFSTILQALQKTQHEKSTGVIVVPYWPTQQWFPVLKRMLMKRPVVLPASHKLLHLPSQPGAIHPLLEKQRLRLLVCKISGNNSLKRDFQKSLLSSSWDHGDKTLTRCTIATLLNGRSTVLQ